MEKLDYNRRQFLFLSSIALMAFGTRFSADGIEQITTTQETDEAQRTNIKKEGLLKSALGIVSFGVGFIAGAKALGRPEKTSTPNFDR